MTAIWADQEASAKGDSTRSVSRARPAGPCGALVAAGRCISQHLVRRPLSPWPDSEEIVSTEGTSCESFC
jgi:hypothetical protein